jgi:undecaprenyl diphosphate synthase
MLVNPAAPKAKATKAPASIGSAIPRHVAIIMDGNGRWARQRGFPRQAGHRAGTENIRRVIEHFAEREVKYLTLFAFSTENWVRPRAEVNALMRLLGRVIDRELKALHANGVRLVHAGCLDPLAADLQQRVRDAIELTKENDRLTLCLAFNYGGRAEILEAVRGLVRDGVRPEEISEDLFASYLRTAGLPDPDLIIRTAGEMRLSNFLIWQAAYAEYYATDVLWPDFDEAEVDCALEAYASRIRRFGGLDPDNAQRRNGHTRL